MAGAPGRVVENRQVVPFLCGQAPGGLVGAFRDAMTIPSGWKVGNRREEAQGAGRWEKCPGRKCAFLGAGQRPHLETAEGTW